VTDNSFAGDLGARLELHTSDATGTDATAHDVARHQHYVCDGPAHLHLFGTDGSDIQHVKATRGQVGTGRIIDT